MTYLVISAVCYSPLLVLQLLAGPATTIEEQLTIMTSGVSFILLLGYWVTLSLLSATVVRLASEDYLGRRLEPSDAVREAVGRLPTVMFALLLKYVFIIIGFFAFFIPALWVLARYFAVTAGIVLEGHGAVGTFGRSARLSRGRKMHILGASLLVFLIFFVVYFALAIVGAMTGSTVITTVFETVASIVAWPMFGITEMLLYYDARIRGEGFDIELMEASLGESAPVAASDYVDRSPRSERSEGL